MHVTKRHEKGVQEYVTCREGDVRSLPFLDNYFDVVTSAVFVHTVGKVYGHRTPHGGGRHGENEGGGETREGPEARRDRDRVSYS
ncbi:hypothetical protein MLD38_006369 [Melastoma candidum]|uniref:Uncharacterized protein n=1 Tax=Melastoma candidum TaxID=119954 RepID=A0ACB9RNW1_9MYRT|nr:hypothetical protein MLD38_006369 [Melastoma candidum]